MNTCVLAQAYSSTSGTHLLPDLFVLRGVGRLLPSVRGVTWRVHVQAVGVHGSRGAMS